MGKWEGSKWQFYPRDPTCCTLTLLIRCTTWHLRNTQWSRLTCHRSNIMTEDSNKLILLICFPIENVSKQNEAKPSVFRELFVALFNRMAKELQNSFKRKSYSKFSKNNWLSF